MEIPRETAVFHDNSHLHRGNFRDQIRHSATLKCLKVTVQQQHKESDPSLNVDSPVSNVMLRCCCAYSF